MNNKAYEFKFLDIDDELVESLDLSNFHFMQDQFLYQYAYVAGLFLQNNVPVSLAALAMPKHAPDRYFIAYVETANGFKDQKNSKLLFHELFNYASQNFVNAEFIIDDYTPDGRKYLQGRAQEIAKDYPNVDFIEAFGFF